MPKPVPKIAKPKAKKLTATKIQPLFNAAIVRRDGSCITSGRREMLQCSHYFTVGASPALRFYPPNAHAQTAREHLLFHHADVLPYTEWMQANVHQLDWMKAARKMTAKFSQATLEHIAVLCRADRLDELTIYIENLLGDTE